MDKLLAKAKLFLDTNLGCNEVELTDAKGNKVRLVRYTPTPMVTYTYPYQYQYQPYYPQT